MNLSCPPITPDLARYSPVLVPYWRHDSVPLLSIPLVCSSAWHRAVEIQPGSTSRRLIGSGSKYCNKSHGLHCRSSRLSVQNRARPEAVQLVSMRASKVGMGFEVRIIPSMPGKDVVIKFAANERRPASLMEVLFCTVASQVDFRKADCMGHRMRHWEQSRQQHESRPASQAVKRDPYQALSFCSEPPYAFPNLFRGQHCVRLMERPDAAERVAEPAEAVFPEQTWKALGDPLHQRPAYSLHPYHQGQGNRKNIGVYAE